MLVLTTLFIANLNSLPRTPNIKMMDVWFIFTLLIPFTEVLLHTAIAALQVLLSLDLFVFFHTKFQSSSLQDESEAKKFTNTRVSPKDRMTIDDQEEDNRVRKIILLAARVGMPAIFVIFCIVFTACAALVRTNHTI